MKTAKDWLVSLGLEAHEEGGYFRRTYTSQTAVHEGVSKVMMSSIFYMLTRDSPIGFLHKNRSDIMHYFHAGSSLDYYLIDSDGELSQVRLGADLDKGEVLQLLVKGGSWKASRLPEGGEYGLISEAVVPGFGLRPFQGRRAGGSTRCFRGRRCGSVRRWGRRAVRPAGRRMPGKLQGIALL